MFKDFPMKIVVPIIVITWILSLVSCLAIVYTLPSAFGIGVGKGSITSDKIADEAVLTVKLADGSVTSAKILDGNITAVDLADGSVIAVKIANGTITTEKIANKTITTEKIADNAIVELKLAGNSVTSAKIVDGTITALDLHDGAITTNKIANGNVTSEKLAPNAIPFAQSTTTYATTTTYPGTNWASYAMYVSITISRPSHFWIMFNTEAYNEGGYYIYARAWITTSVSSGAASPPQMTLTPYNVWQSFSCNFYYYAFAQSYPASIGVQIQWQVAGSTGHLGSRSLAVIVFPA